MKEFEKIQKEVCQNISAFLSVTNFLKRFLFKV